MHLGTQTGSLNNHLFSRMVIGQPEPTVGMGATVLMWTDRQAATIVEVFKIGKAVAIAVEDDREVLVSGSKQEGNDVWEYRANPGGHRRHFRQREGGMWEAVHVNQDTGRWVKSHGNGLRIGERETYRDPSF